MTIDRVTVPSYDEVPEFDHERAQAAIRELLLAMGEDPDRDGLQDTPARVARAFEELIGGIRMKPQDVLATTFELGHDEMILVRDIELWSLCEHHLVPFSGVAHVGYIPNESGRITRSRATRSFASVIVEAIPALTAPSTPTARRLPPHNWPAQAAPVARPSSQVPCGKSGSDTRGVPYAPAPARAGPKRAATSAAAAPATKTRREQVCREPGVIAGGTLRRARRRGR